MKKTAIGTIVWGMILIGLGVGFLLNSMDVINFDDFLSHYWPLILIIIGISELIQRKFVSALIWNGIGLAFLVNTLDIYTFDVGSIIGPLILIIIGLHFLMRALPHADATSDTSDTVTATTVFGDTKKKINSPQFTVGTINTLFGDTKLDLRQAHISEGGAMIDVLVLFGGATIYMPAGTAVKLETTAIFGGSEDKRSAEQAPGPSKQTVTVKGLVMFGSLEIKD
jgi:predicted membrane protein